MEPASASGPGCRGCCHFPVYWEDRAILSREPLLFIYGSGWLRAHIPVKLDRRGDGRASDLFVCVCVIVLTVVIVLAVMLV